MNTGTSPKSSHTVETQTSSTRPEAEAKRREVIPLKDPMNDKPTFREVFLAEESPLLRFAYGFVGQRQTAEDIVQDAFLKLHSHWEEVKQPRAWLYRCVRNLALNHIRDHRRETELDPEHDTPGKDDVPEELLGRMEAVGTVQLLLAEMAPEDRELITLKYNEGLKYSQISERTGISVGNVGYKLHHLLKDLADSLRSQGIESPQG
jgi:RNA polymerase sigma factor (sigma-70 family)